MRLLTVFLLAILTSCGGSEGPPPAGREILPEPDILDRLHSQKAALDSLAGGDTLARYTGSRAAAAYTEGDNPSDSLESIYLLQRGSDGRIVAVHDQPYSLSGDWNIDFVHLFDKNGRTFATIRRTNFFNSGCADVAYEEIVRYYDAQGRMRDSSYSLTGDNGKKLDPKACTFFYDSAFTMYSDTFQLLKQLSGKQTGR